MKTGRLVFGVLLLATIHYSLATIFKGDTIRQWRTTGNINKGGGDAANGGKRKESLCLCVSLVNDLLEEFL
jgi:hypothetical protein